jgi:RHS repeat-associated protein
MVYGDAGHPNLLTQIVQRGFTPSGTAVSRAVILGYNAFGQVNSINGPRTDANDVTTLEYYECTTGGSCGQLKKVTNALGHITTYDLYDANGRLLQMTDPNGLVTTYAYDPRGRVRTITRTPASGSAATTQHSYTPWGDVSQVIDPDGVTLNYQYDAAHDLRFIVDAAGNYIHYKYDLKGNRTGEDTHDLSGVLMRSVGYTYDLRNRPSQINLAGDITQTVHDAVGNLTSETDPNNHATTHQYDALNRLFKTVNALTQETNYGLDNNDRPTVVTAPNGLSTQYQYDDLGNLLMEISPDRSTTTYSYDAAGNVLTVKDARNITTTYAYDALNRVTLQQSSDAGTPRYNYYYDTCFKGALCWIQQNNTFHLYFGYDGLGRQNYQLNATGAAWLFNMAGYSPGGRLTSLTYPSGRTVDYTYDFQNTDSPKLGRVSQVSTTNGVTTILAKNFMYQPFGPVQSFLFGHNRSYWTSLDQAYRPVYQFSGPRYKYATYDPAGNLKSLTDINSTSQTFDYSALNELTAASDTQAGSYGSLSYSYLPNGNREQEIRNGTATTYYYYDNTNRLYHAGDSDWRLMDVAGNTTWSNGLWGVSYDGYGRLLSSSRAQSSYGYNAFNQRTRKTAGGVTTSFLYGPRGELLYETDGTNDKIYVYLDEMPLARIDNNSQIYYYHTDHLGAPQLMTNSAGTTVWKATYDPFGQATITTSTITNNLRLAGQYFDQETGLHYNWHRYYDPKVGRYISSDPIGLKGGLNTYAYVKNNPLRWTDPSGLAIWICYRTLNGGVPGNHSYLWDDNKKRCCGRVPGTDPLADCNEKGPPTDYCVKVAASDGREDGVMRCCGTRGKRGTYVPFGNDCVNTVQDCVQGSGLSLPPSPPGGPRTGSCPSCNTKETPTLPMVP